MPISVLLSSSAFCSAGEFAPSFAETDDGNKSQRYCNGIDRKRLRRVARRAPGQRFLAAHFGNKPLRLQDLQPHDLHRFILRQVPSGSRAYSKLMVTALRSFLRFLCQRGSIKNDFASALFGVAHWQLSHLPKSLPPDQVERLLRCCDRSTASGQRDYAILLLLARLGLRGGEVLAMTLDDLDWERGEILIRGKGQRLERLPLPKEVGTALVMASTDLGRARSNLAGLFAGLSAAVAHGLVRTLTGASGEEMRVKHRDLIRRTIALDPVIDEVMGEAPDLRLGSQGLWAAVEGLFISLSSWRLVANHLELLPGEQRHPEADTILQRIPAALRSTTVKRDAASWVDNAIHLRRICGAAVRAMVALPAHTASLRMLADGAAQALIGIARSLDGMTLLVGRDRSAPRVRAAPLPIPDYLPALINATRIFVVICAAELFWVTTEWPSGALAIAWSTIFITSYSPDAEQAYATAKSRSLGITMAAVCGAIIKFALLPGSETFTGLATAIGVVLVPAAALSTLTWRPAIFAAIASWFISFVHSRSA